MIFTLDPIASGLRCSTWGARMRNAHGRRRAGSSSYAVRAALFTKWFNGIMPFSMCNADFLSSTGSIYSFNSNYDNAASINAFKEYAWGNCGAIGLMTGNPTGRTNYSHSVQQFQLYGSRADWLLNHAGQIWTQGLTSPGQCPTAGGSLYHPSGYVDALGGLSFWNLDYLSIPLDGGGYWLANWDYGVGIDDPVSAAHFSYYYNTGHVDPNQQWAASLSNLIDFGPLHQSAYAAMTAKSLSLDFAALAWSAQFNDAPSVFAQPGYFYPAEVGLGSSVPDGAGVMVYLGAAPYNDPSIYDGTVQQIGTYNYAPVLLPQQNIGSTQAATSSGWCVNRQWQINLWRGQLKNTDAAQALSYYVMKYQGFGRLSGSYVVNPNGPDCSSAGAFVPSGAIVTVVSGPHYLSPSGLSGDTVECPQPTHKVGGADVYDNFWPSGGFMQASNAAIVESFCFLIVNTTPSAWAVANGYWAPSPHVHSTSDSTGSTSDDTGLTSD
jgi:hypothetical protein